MSGIGTVRNNVGVVIINALGWVLLSREYRAALKTAIARGLSAQSVDLTLAAVGYADLLAEVERLRGSADAWWTEYDRELQAHEATKAETEQLQRIINGYDRTPAEQRAADAEAERDAARAALDRVRALADEWDQTDGDISPLDAAGDLRTVLHSTEEPR